MNKIPPIDLHRYLLYSTTFTDKIQVLCIKKTQFSDFRKNGRTSPSVWPYVFPYFRAHLPIGGNADSGTESAYSFTATSIPSKKARVGQLPRFSHSFPPRHATGASAPSAARRISPAVISPAARESSYPPPAPRLPTISPARSSEGTICSKYLTGIPVASAASLSGVRPPRSRKAIANLSAYLPFVETSISPPSCSLLYARTARLSSAGIKNARAGDTFPNGAA